MRFSIITITKNNPAGLSRTEVSVKKQSFTDYEWIIIDGEKEPDHGIYDAMNKGIAHAKGDYLIFMNAGDEFATSEALGLIAEYRADFIYGDAIEGGQMKLARHYTKIAHGMITHHQAMIYRRTTVGDMRYDMAYDLAADYKFTCAFLQKARSVVYINSALCIFEQGGASQTQAAKARAEEAHIRRSYGIRAPFTPLRQWMAVILRQNFPIFYATLRAGKIARSAAE